MSVPTDISTDDALQSRSDHSLLRLLRGGSEDAATKLYLRYAHRLLALIRARASHQLKRRIDPEDLVQSVFRRFFRRVQHGDYDVPAGEELWGLFLVIALNRIRAEESYQRCAKRDLNRIAPAELDRAEPGGSTNETAFTVLQLTLQDAMAQLPQAQRQMLELRIQGHEVAEIAARTGRSKRTIERNLQEVRAHLRTLLEFSPSGEDDVADRPHESDVSDTR